MQMIFKPLIDLVVIATILFAITGPCLVILFLSVKNTISREEKVEIITAVEDALHYALWNLKWLFGGSEKKVIAWSVFSIVAAAVLAVITQQINDGVWTMLGVAQTLFGLAVTVGIGGFVLWLINSETKKKVLVWLASAAIAIYLLCQLTIGLNNGTFTFGDFGLYALYVLGGLGVLILLVLIFLAYCFWQEHKTSLSQQYD